MKKVFVISIVSTLLLLTSCHFSSSHIGSGNFIEPSGTIVKKEFPQQAFDKVDIDVVANVKFIQDRDSNSRVTISAPDNYIELFSMDVEANKLKVRFNKRNIDIDPTNVDVIICAPQLRELRNCGVANVETDRLTTNQLKLDNSGVGKLYFSGLDVSDLSVDCSGVGGVQISGTAEKATLECSGVGGIEADELKADEVEADISGVGGITCYANQRIKGVVSGVGALTYKGNPTTKELKRTGIGQISKADE